MERAPFSDYTLPRHSLIRARRAEAMLRRLFGDTAIEELARPLFTVSADLLSAQMVVHREGPLVEAVGSSMAIPGLAPPVSYQRAAPHRRRRPQQFANRPHGRRRAGAGRGSRCHASAIS